MRRNKQPKRWYIKYLCGLRLLLSNTTSGHPLSSLRSVTLTVNTMVQSDHVTNEQFQIPVMCNRSTACLGMKHDDWPCNLTCELLMLHAAATAHDGRLHAYTNTSLTGQSYPIRNDKSCATVHLCTNRNRSSEPCHLRLAVLGVKHESRGLPSPISAKD